VNVVALDDALNRLAALDARQATIVEIAIFRGSFHRGNRDSPRVVAFDREERLDRGEDMDPAVSRSLAVRENH